MRTVDTAAEYLGPEADGPVGVPGLRVDADETGHSGDGKGPENRSLRVLVPFEYLYNSGSNRTQCLFNRDFINR